jgi:hypothetical protein
MSYFLHTSAPIPPTADANAIVLDIGTSTTKIGFAGSEIPFVLPSVRRSEADRCSPTYPSYAPSHPHPATRADRCSGVRRCIGRIFLLQLHRCVRKRIYSGPSPLMARYSPSPLPCPLPPFSNVRFPRRHRLWLWRIALHQPRDVHPCRHILSSPRRAVPPPPSPAFRPRDELGRGRHAPRPRTL